MKQTIKLDTIEVSQEKSINLNLKIAHLILLDYLYQFFSSGSAKVIYNQNNEPYFYITLNKILSDMPIFCIKKRRLQELFLDLETAKIIERFSKKNSPSIFIKLNLSLLEP